MQDKERLVIFKLAIRTAIKKLIKGTSATTVLGSYDIAPSIITPMKKGIKDPQLSTVFRISQAYRIDPRVFVEMVMEELPEGFLFSEE